METIAVVDIGTNSIKCLIAEIDQTTYFPLEEVLFNCRLGQGLYHSGSLSPEAMERSLSALDACMATARRHHAGKIIAVGTMALRSAKNADVFIEKVRSLGILIRVLSGEEEARLSYRAAVQCPAGEKVVCDIGGGSTECILGKGKELTVRKSLRVGAVLAWEKFIHTDPVSREEFSAMERYIAKEIKGHAPQARASQIVAVGGTATTMAAVHLEMSTYCAAEIQGTLLSRDDIERQLQRYLARTTARRREIPGLPQARADIIIAGATIVAKLMDFFGASTLKVSNCGLRHGVILDRYFSEGT